jgi:hypothetical protein
VVKPVFIWPLAFTAMVVFSASSNAQADEVIPSTLQCSALSKQPEKYPRFTGTIIFSVVNSSFKGERSWMNPDGGKEIFSGNINRDKTMTIAGRGAYTDGHSSWRYEFYGPLKGTDLPVVKGSLTSYRTGAKRDCSITFLLASDKLLAVLASANEPAKGSGALLQDPEKTKKQLEDMSRDLADKQNELQAAQDAFKEQQDKLAVAAKNLDDQRKTLATDHQVLIQEQAKTSKDVNFVQNVLAGIILPTTEDPKSWTIRVASVPVQQQQFCRIVDQFYDTIGKVYETHNEIKKNSLFRERQQSMAALLPRGEFSNWVVQVKEVTQAPDGSAAVMSSRLAA